MVAMIIFSFYAWNAVPVDETDISLSVLNIGRGLPFTIELSLAISR